MTRHVLAVAGYVAAVGWWLWPLMTRIADAIPGPGAGDNVSFVWNVWWTRYALQHPATSVFFTPLLFHPFGVDLTLHTHTLLPAVLVSGIANPVLAQNVLIAAHLLLNFVCAYALAYRETRHWTASLIAAGVFGWSPYLSAHLQGHFNLIAAWVLPLSGLLAVMASDSPTISRGAWLGVALGMTAYVDYYYFIYGVLLTALLILASPVTMRRVEKDERTWERWMTRGLVALIAIDALIVMWILVTGGTELQLAGVRISMRSIANPVAAAWLLGLVWLAVRSSRTVRVRIDRAALRARIPAIATAMVVVIGILIPLMIHAMAFWRSGEYTTQQYFWRSAPAGIDLTTVLLGNPFSLVYGRVVTSLYEALGVDLVEHVAWLGPAVLAFIIIAIRRCGAAAARWVVVAAVFGVWCLGPYVEIAGHGTTLWLPAILVRWIPLVANARIPARAIVVVYLGCAILTAHAAAWLLRGQRRGPILATALTSLLVLDYMPRRPPLYQLDRPSIYTQLPDAGTRGAVWELPFGVRDGFGELGKFDSRVLYYQTIHERPVLGGFVARLPRSVAQRYEAMPVVGSLLRLSGGGPLSAEHPERDRDQAPATLASLGIRYVIVTSASSPPDLVEYVRRVLPLRLLAQDEQRRVYVVAGASD